MEITHVVRGDDHISNTPKHVLLFEAFGATIPQFAHVPLILGTDKKRLSKRHGATSVTEYQRLGYLPEAMVNFLALLGWSPGTDEELFTKAELVDRFSLEGISGGNAVFNPDKLDWFNQQQMMRLPAGELANRVAPLLRDAGLWRDAGIVRSPVARTGDRAPETAREEARQFVEDGRIFRRGRGYDPAAVRSSRAAGWHASSIRDAPAGARRRCPLRGPALRLRFSRAGGSSRHQTGRTHSCHCVAVPARSVRDSSRCWSF
jgi:glutamyl/glutaminyl-tRNA synthetase